MKLNFLLTNQQIYKSVPSLFCVGVLWSSYRAVYAVLYCLREILRSDSFKA